MVIGRLNALIAAADNDRLQLEVAPGRNRIFYLVAHLTAVHDLMLPLLRIGDRLHPELDAPYLEKPDRTLPDSISPDDLKKAWTAVNDKLTPAIEKFTAEEWLERHASVSPGDFAKDPSRNRFAVLLSRTNHAWSHAGQIQLVK